MFVPWDKVGPPVIFNMYPYQHSGGENRFQQDENENNPSEDSVAAFEKNLAAKLTDFLGAPHDEEQPSEGRHSRPLQDHNNGEQQSGERHSRPLEDPYCGEQPSGDKTSESEAGNYKKKVGRDVDN